MNQQNNFQSKVPSWNGNYCQQIEYVPVEIQKFYHHLVEQISNGNFIDIKGETYYIQLYIRTVVEQFIKDKNIEILIRRFEKIRQAYGNYPDIEHTLLFFTGDAYLYLEKYDNAWFFMRQRYVSIKDIVDVRAKCRETSIDCRDLTNALIGYKASLTKFGNNNSESILKIISINLNSFHKRHGKNLIEYFCQQFDFANLNDKDFSKLREYFDSAEDFSFLKKTYELQEKEYYLDEKKYDFHFRRYLFPTLDLTAFIACKPIPSIILKAIKNDIRRMMREFENTLREEMSIPRIGEGWVAETELFYKLREYFPSERIVNHARPVWLAPQHLDIYFPERNIGIEYQGLQHQKPVEYFGGQKAFEKQQERDKRKEQLCNENKCQLIYVYEGYSFEEIAKKIKFLLEQSDVM